MTVGDAFLTSAEASLLQLYANEAATLDGHPGGVHQSRVALRRLRATLGAFARALPAADRKAFNKEFRRLQKKLAPARDWHVLLDETIPRLILDGVDAALLESLREVGHAELRRATEKAAEWLRSERFSRLLLEFEGWPARLAGLDPDGRLAEPITPFALTVLERRRQDLLADRRPLEQMSAEELHGLRIRGKKARYVGELFRAMFEAERAAPQLELLSQFQDRLGEATDASTARQSLTWIEPGCLPGETIRALEQWSRERILVCVRRAQPLWRRLQEIDPFWRARDGSGGASR